MPHNKGGYARPTDFWKSEATMYLNESRCDCRQFGVVFRELFKMRLDDRPLTDVVDILNAGYCNISADKEPTMKLVIFAGLECYATFGNLDLFFDMIETFGGNRGYRGGY